MSKNAGKSEMKQANRLMRDNIARLEAIGIPTIEAQRIALEAPELVGVLEAEQLAPSRFEEIQMDPRLQAAQMAALEDVSGIAKTGLGAEDRLALEEASAADAIAQFNAQNRQNVAGRNLGERQRVAEAGSATRNQEQMYNKALIQQQFQNEMAKATGVTGSQTNLANLYGQQAAAAQQAQQAQTGAILGAAGTLGAAALKKG